RGKQVKKPGGIFYTPATGIWQTVWLEPVRTSHIESVVIIPDVDANEIRFKAVVKKTEVDSSILIQSRNKSFESVNGKPNQEIRVPMKDARLWNPDNPVLYECDVILTDFTNDSAATDTARCYFALRKIELGKDDKGTTRILLNGKPYFQV